MELIPAPVHVPATVLDLDPLLWPEINDVGAAMFAMTCKRAAVERPRARRTTSFWVRAAERGYRDLLAKWIWDPSVAPALWLPYAGRILTALLQRHEGETATYLYHLMGLITGGRNQRYVQYDKYHHVMVLDEPVPFPLMDPVLVEPPAKRRCMRHIGSSEIMEAQEATKERYEEEDVTHMDAI